LNGFLGRALHDYKTTFISDSYFASRAGIFSKPAFYWSEIFLFGVTRGLNGLNLPQIIPSQSNFIDSYYDLFFPETFSDYRDANLIFLFETFYKYIADGSQTIRKANIIGRTEELFNFLANKFSLMLPPSLGTLRPGFQKIFLNKLMKNLVLPGSEKTDWAKRLYRVQSTNGKDSFPVGRISGYTWVFLETDSNEINNAFRNNRLTSNTIYTWKFSEYSIHSRINSDYFMDFDIVWDSILREKFEAAHTLLYNAFSRIPTSPAASVTIRLYGRTNVGIDTMQTIDKSPTSLDTEFKVAEIDVNLNNPSQAIISLLAWMILEPNIFAEVDWNGKNFLNLDIYDLYDFDYTQLGTASNKMSNRPFVWTETEEGSVFTPGAFKILQNEFTQIFDFKDIIKYIFYVRINPFIV